MCSAWSRRNFLQMSGLVTLVSVSGCSLSEPGTRGLELGDVFVRNVRENPYTVRIELARNGELVREKTVEVAGDEGIEVLQATWPDTPAVYTLRYAIGGPDAELDIRTKTITAADKRAADQACAVPAITLAPHEPPYVQVGNTETMGMDCSSN